MSTFIFGRWVFLGMKLCIGIGSVLDVIFLIGSPAETECLAFGLASGVLINTGEIVSIGCWFFLCVSEDDVGDGAARALAEGAALVGVS